MANARQTRTQAQIDQVDNDFDTYTPIVADVSLNLSDRTVYGVTNTDVDLSMVNLQFLKDYSTFRNTWVSGPTSGGQSIPYVSGDVVIGSDSHIYALTSGGDGTVDPTMSGQTAWTLLSSADVLGARGFSTTDTYTMNNVIYRNDGTSNAGLTYVYINATDTTGAQAPLPAVGTVSNSHWMQIGGGGLNINGTDGILRIDTGNAVSATINNNVATFNVAGLMIQSVIIDGVGIGLDSNNVVTFNAGTKIDITRDGTNQAINIDHETTTRADTTGSLTPSAGSTVDVLTGLTSDATGHLTGTNTRTITLPSDPNIEVRAGSATNTAEIGLDSNTATATIVGSHGVNVSANATTDDITIGYGVPLFDNTVSYTIGNLVRDNNGQIYEARRAVAAGPSSALTNTGDWLQLSTGGNLGPNTTYNISAETVGTNTAIRLTGSDSSTDDISLAGNDGIRISHTNADSIIIDYGLEAYAAANQYESGALVYGGTNDPNIYRANADLDPNLHTLTGNFTLLTEDTNTTYTGGTGITIDSNNAINQDTITNADSTSTATPAHGGTFTTVDSVTRNTTGHVTAINTKTVTLPADNDTTYTGGTGITISSSNAIAQDAVTQVPTTSADSPDHAGTFTTVGGVSVNATGHVTGIDTQSVTLPATNIPIHDPSTSYAIDQPVTSDSILFVSNQANNNTVPYDVISLTSAVLDSTNLTLTLQRADPVHPDGDTTPPNYMYTLEFISGVETYFVTFAGSNVTYDRANAPLVWTIPRNGTGVTFTPSYTGNTVTSVTRFSVESTYWDRIGGGTSTGVVTQDVNLGIWDSDTGNPAVQVSGSGDMIEFRNLARNIVFDSTNRRYVIDFGAAAVTATGQSTVNPTSFNIFTNNNTATLIYTFDNGVVVNTSDITTPPTISSPGILSAPVISDHTVTYNITGLSFQQLNTVYNISDATFNLTRDDGTGMDTVTITATPITTTDNRAYNITPVTASMDVFDLDGTTRVTFRIDGTNFDATDTDITVSSITVAGNVLSPQPTISRQTSFISFSVDGNTFIPDGRTPVSAIISDARLTPTRTETVSTEYVSTDRRSYSSVAVNDSSISIIGASDAVLTPTTTGFDFADSSVRRTVLLLDGTVLSGTDLTLNNNGSVTIPASNFITQATGNLTLNIRDDRLPGDVFTQARSVNTSVYTPFWFGTSVPAPLNLTDLQAFTEGQNFAVGESINVTGTSGETLFIAVLASTLVGFNNNTFRLQNPISMNIVSPVMVSSVILQRNDSTNLTYNIFNAGTFANAVTYNIINGA